MTRLSHSGRLCIGIINRGISSSNRILLLALTFLIFAFQTLCITFFWRIDIVEIGGCNGASFSGLRNHFLKFLF